jgi:DNA-binding CsgD family transcriptional regulator
VAQSVPGTRVVSPALIGREAELRRVAAAVAAPPAVVVVDGEAGIGKTRLVTELAARPELARRRMLVGRCHQIRESFPLGPVVEAMRGVDLPAARWSPLVGALRSLLPEVAERLPPAPGPLDDRGAERHRVFRAMVEVLGALGPALLVLEDLHWADDQTAAFVGYLLSEAPAELALAVTFRGEEVDPHLRSSIAKLPAGTTRTDVVLEPLDAAGTGALAAAIVGVDRVSDAFAAYLYERTSGLPFAIEELLALLRAQGKLVQRDGAWARRALDELDVPAGIRDPVLARVSRLGAAAREVTEAAAVLSVPVPVDTLVASGRAPAEQALVAVEETLESGLLVEHGEAVGFRHPLAAQAVYDGIPGPRRRDLHGRAAAALGSAGPVPLGQVAHHLRRAGRLGEWVGAAERAADQALALGHDAEAFRLLEDVLRHAPLDPHRRGRLAVRLSQAAIEVLRARDVVDLLSAVLEHDLPAAERAELRFRMVMLRHELGEDSLPVRRLLAEAVDELAHRPDLRAWGMVVLGIPSVKDIDLAECRRWLERALATVPSVADRAFQVYVLGKLAMVLTSLGDPRWWELVRQIEERTQGAPQQRREVNAYWSVGAEAVYAGHHQVAGRLLGAALAYAVADQNQRLELGIRADLVLLRYSTGAWDGLAAEAARLADELAGFPRARVDVDIVVACLALAQGDPADAYQRLTSVEDLAGRVGGFDVLPVPVSALIRLLLARGEAAAAAESAERLVAMVDSKEVWPSGARALPAITVALAAAGRAERARAVVDDLESQLAKLDAPMAPAALAHARGLLLCVTGENRAAVAQLVTAASRYEPLGCPYEAALAAEQAAQAQFAVGDAEAAQATLRAALRGFHRVGAAWDAGRATRIARQYGISVPARHRGGRRGYGSGLSPREREVAELAATGRSNKEIAGELFLSVNTVARHISAAMRKLDARSRAALAYRLVGHSDDQN